MSVLLRPVRPLAWLAAGAAVSGVPYDITGNRSRREHPDDPTESTYEQPLMIQESSYIPSPSQRASGNSDLEALVHLHELGVIGDQEFAAGKAKLREL